MPSSSPPRPTAPASAANLSATCYACGRSRHAPHRQLRVGTHLGDSACRSVATSSVIGHASGARRGRLSSPASRAPVSPTDRFDAH
eukprot:3075215-Prymnesium_polylepis.1